MGELLSRDFGLIVLLGRWCKVNPDYFIKETVALPSPKDGLLSKCGPVSVKISGIPQGLMLRFSQQGLWFRSKTAIEIFGKIEVEPIFLDGESPPGRDAHTLIIYRFHQLRIIVGYPLVI